MKKKILYIITLILLLVVGRNVYAYELTCPPGPFNYNEIFECNIFGTNTLYDSLSGTLDKDNYLDCFFDKTKVEDLDIVDDPTKSFSLKGQAFNTKLVTFSCKVTRKLDSSATTSISISDFKYVPANGKGDEIILHSKDISINKYVDPSGNKSRDTSYDGSLIKTLSIEGVTLPNAGFSKYLTEYTIKVPYNIDSLKFDVTLVDSNANYEIQGDTKNLKVTEENVIDILVTSADNTHQTCYTFKVWRQAEGQEIYYPEEDATLSKLTVDGYVIDFEKDVLEYNLNVGATVTALKVTALPTVEGAKVTITDTNAIEDGTVIGITVVSKNLINKKTYKIFIHKEKKSVVASSTYIVIAVILVLTALLILFVRSSRKKFEFADGSGEVGKKKKKEEVNPLDSVPEVGGADISGLQAVTKNETAQINVIKVNENNVAQVMQDTEQHNVQLNQVSSATRNVVMTQKTAAMPKVVADNQNVINENDYQGDIYEERDANGNFLRYVDAEGNTIEYVDEYGNQISIDE